MDEQMDLDTEVSPSNAVESDTDVLQEAMPPVLSPEGAASGEGRSQEHEAAGGAGSGAAAEDEDAALAQLMQEEENLTMDVSMFSKGDPQSQGGSLPKMSNARFYNGFDDDFDESDMKLKQSSRNSTRSAQATNRHPSIFLLRFKQRKKCIDPDHFILLLD
eukprot:TRINITY_DN6460_c0_g2_i2.p1 TRINITY_DN6460_c0_g2~~TRINITY_DN6460_c0_g2_i2.p1  ORF type:complete len:161 (+),score=34.30 TRINITY_DN6460_c0_g2_i2:276-758(+)